MIHHGQRLPLGLEARDDLLGVHAQLDDLERHAPAHRLGLLGHIDHAATAFADFLQQLVANGKLPGRKGLFQICAMALGRPIIRPGFVPAPDELPHP
jgi:hypothetical protein